MFTGAPLSKEVGDIIASRTKLHNTIGSTEVGAFPVYISNSTEWDYFRFHPYSGYHMEAHEGRESYELVLRQDPALHDFQSVFHLYPEATEYHTKDLFTPHPAKPNLWKYQGRVDDLIILSHGEDLDPLEMEKIVARHPLVTAAVIGGHGRSAPFAIVEMAENNTMDPRESDKVVDQIWPSFIEANKICSSYVRVQKSNVILTSLEKPLLKTLKGSINRQKSLLAYEEEIKALFSCAK